MSLRIVLVEPEHDLNVGSACRAMKNFGVKELCLVNPKARLGADAVRYAKHSLDVLEGAKKFPSLSAALRGCDLAIATTGISERFHGRLKKCVSSRQLPSLLKGVKRAAIVFGPESRGLSQKELSQCDAVATIPASAEHPVLNLSHAVAVVLYELYATSSRPVGKGVLRAIAPREKRLLLEKLFASVARGVESVRDAQKVSAAFRNVCERAKLQEDECQALLAVLGPLSRKFKSFRR